MHRKFIAFIIAAALAVTGISAAAPARADPDPAKLLAGLTALAIIGMAINDHDKRRHERIVVSRPAPPPPVAGRHRWAPRPRAHHRYILPRQCLRQVGPRGAVRLRMGRHCLQRTYPEARSLPSQCYRQDWTRHGLRQGYGVHCLLQRGYRLSRY